MNSSGVQRGLISLANPGTTLGNAYAIQDAFLAAKMATGLTQIGWKIGLTSRATQQVLDITTPDSGVLLSDMLFHTGHAVARGRFIMPRIQAEIAFVMGHGLSGPDVNRNDVIAGTEQVSPSLEILDTRVMRADPETGTSRIIFGTLRKKQPTRAWFWGRKNTKLTRMICGGRVPLSNVMAWSSKPDWGQGCLMIR